MKIRITCACIVLCTMCMLSSCSWRHVRDIPNDVIGISIPHLDDPSLKHYTKTYQEAPSQMIEIIHMVIGMLKAHVYRSKKDMIAARGFTAAFSMASDTTELAFYVKKIDNTKTEVTVISPNSELAEFVAQKLYATIEHTNEPTTF